MCLSFSTQFTSFRDKNKWDVFRETSHDNISSSDLNFWNSAFRVTKVIFAVVLFVFVLGTAVISKGTLFLLVSNIFPPNEMRNSSLKTANGYFRYHTPCKLFLFFIRKFDKLIYMLNKNITYFIYRLISQ